MRIKIARALRALADRLDATPAMSVTTSSVSGLVYRTDGTGYTVPASDNLNGSWRVY